MVTLFVNDGWAVMNHFVDILLPLSIFVVLPVLVVWILMRERRHETDKKTEIMLKAIENGTQLAPDLFAGSKTVSETIRTKRKLMGYLITATVTGLIGLLTLAAQLVLYFVYDVWSSVGDYGPLVLFICVSSILLAVGISFLIVYSVGKRIYGDEFTTPENEE